MIKNYVIIISFIFSILLISSCKTPENQKEPPKAKMGVLDLSDWDFEKDGNLKLDGEWEFYWNKLLTPNDFITKTNSVDAYITLPNYWNGTTINNKELGGKGFGTFRLIIEANNTNENLTLDVYEIISAYKVFFDGDLILEMGQVSENEKNSIAKYVPTSNRITINKERIEIIIQVSNHEHRLGGFYKVPQIKNEKKAQFDNYTETAYEFFLFGSILIIAFYHFGLFFMRRKDKAVLAFGIFTLAIAFRVLTTGSEFFAQTINLEWALNYRLEYFSLYGAYAAFVLFLYFAYKKYFHKFLFWIMIGVSAVFSLSLFLPVNIFSFFITHFQMFLLASLFYFMFVLIKGVIKKQDGSTILLITIALFFGAVINDIFYFRSVIRTAEITPLGTFAFILGQSLFLARRFTKAFDKNEELTETLDYQNKNLEKIVADRTKTVELQKHEIMEKHEELLQQNEEIIAQRDEIEETKNVLEEKNNHILSSINYASTIQQAILPIQSNLDEKFENFVIYLPKDVVSGDFYWTSFAHEKCDFIAVVDCTGHGVPGAFMSMIGSHILNELVNHRQILEPAQILTLMDEEVKKFLKQEETENRDGMDLVICRLKKLDNDQTEIVFEGAKQSLFYYSQQEKKINRIKGARKSIGSLSSSRNPVVFENRKIVLKKGDQIYMTTDGLIDQNNYERVRYGTKKLFRLVEQNANRSMEIQKKIVLKSLSEYMKGVEQRDDITFIGLKI